MSNRQLGDEFAYVLDRKIQTRYIGNSLEKPSLALKRNLVKNTTQDTEQLKQDGRRRSRSGSITPKENVNLLDASYSSGDRSYSSPRCVKEEEGEDCDDARYCQLNNLGAAY